MGNDRTISYVLSNRAFLILIIGVGFSLIGEGMFMVALTWAVLHIYHTATSLATIFIASSIPLLLATIVGGFIADKFDRRVTMIVSDVVRALAVAVLGLIFIAKNPPLWLPTVSVMVIGTFIAFFNPAYGAIVPEVVAKEDLRAANSIISFIQPLCVRVIGPAIGGAVIAWLGASWALWVDALTFLASIHSAYYLIRSGIAPHSKPKPGLDLSHIRLYISRKSLLVALIVDAVVLLIFWGPYRVVLPKFLVEGLLAAPSSYSMFFVMGGVGAMIGSLVFGKYTKLPSTVTACCVVWAIGGALTGLYAVTSSIFLFCAVAFVSNFLFTLGNVIYRTLLQRVVPKEQLGRAISVSITAQGLGAQGSYVAAATYGDMVNARLIFLFSGIVSLLFGVGGAILSRRLVASEQRLEVDDKTIVPTIRGA